MKKVLVINGPNINMLGKREPELYGNTTYKELVKNIKTWAKELNMQVDVYQSNEEGKLISKIQKSLGRYEGLIINAGGYTHTSIAIMDAISSVKLPTVEVHITDIDSREDFRKNSYISLVADKKIVGQGILGYKLALEWCAHIIGYLK